MRVKHIIRFTALFIMLAAGFVIAQGTIQGTVSDQDGNALPGANVVVEGTSLGGSTDGNGTYSITDVPAGSYNVTASFIGYETESQSVEVGAEATQADFTLSSSALAGEEVIVTALGIKKEKKALTYAAQDIKAEELTRVKNANLFNNLSGRIAGIAVNRSASGTGGTVKLTIRGNSSTTNNQPLYVIDGVPVTNVSPAQAESLWGGGLGGRDGGDAVSLINPDDVESMTVLKGASASALYGSQGANGVVLINTKKGTVGKPRINVSSSTTFDQVVELPSFQTSYTAADGAESSWGGGAGSSDNHVPGFFDVGKTQINSVSLSTGTANAQTYFSYANTSATGVIPTNELIKHNVNLRETANFGNISVDASISLSDQNIHNKPTSGFYYNALTGLYWFPRGNDFNTYETDYETYNATRNLMAQNWLTDSHTDQNPFWILNRNASDDRNQRVLATSSFGYRINDNLSLRSRLSYDKQLNTFEKKAYATTQTTLSHTNGRYIYLKSENTQVYADLIATYNTSLGGSLDLTANGGTSIRNTRIGDGINLDSGTSPGLDKANWFTLANFAGVNYLNQTVGSKKEMQSVFGSAQIGFNGTWYADVTARQDYSSALWDEEKKETTPFFYPSFGVTGIISEMMSLPQVDFAKVRFSYSQVGSDIPAFITSPRNTIAAGSVSGPSVGPQPGTTLEPELQTSTEFGTDWKFLDNTVGFELTAYNSKTENQFILIQAPDTNPFGYQNYAFNAASIENTGIEFSLYATPVRSDNLSWTTNLNYASNTNEVSGIPDDLGGRVVISDAGVNGYQYVLENGKPFGVIEAKKLTRDDQGRIVLDADGNLQKGDFEEVGIANPDFTLGWSNSINFGDFSVNFLVDGRFGGEVMSVTEAMNDMFGVSKASGDARDAGGVSIDAVDASGNAVSTYDAEAYYSLIGNRAGALGEYIYDATNISLRELSVAYRYKNAVISLIGRNLFFIMKDAPFDPNISMSTGEGMQGVDSYGLPSTRSIGLSVNLTF